MEANGGAEGEKNKFSILCNQWRILHGLKKRVSCHGAAADMHAWYIIMATTTTTKTWSSKRLLN